MSIPVPIENNPVLSGIAGTGQVTAMHVFEALPTRVGNVIPAGTTGSNWGIHLEWEVNGPIATGMAAATWNWRVRVYLESLGPGTEYSLPGAAAFTVPFATGVLSGDTRSWDQNLNITAAVDPVASGLYKLGVVLQMENPAGPTLVPIVGFIEGSLIQFY